jgi:formiminoglutamate deiminase
VDAQRGAPHARIGAAVHSVRAVPREQLGTVADWARERGAPLHVHLSEQPAENEQCLAAYGISPTRLLAEAGALGPRTVAVHATHLDEADIGLLGTTRTGVCMCPTTERDLADGIGPAAALIARGVPLSLGSDSHAVVDLFEEARGVELGERVLSRRRGHVDSAALLAAATAGGAASLGWDDLGTLVPGALADLVTVSLDSVRLAGWSDDALLEAAVFAATASDVRAVVVGGALVVDEGRSLRIPDVAGELHRAIRALTENPAA